MLDPCTWTQLALPAALDPILVVVIDTEAESDWISDHPRDARGIASVRRQIAAQRIFERYNVRPTFVLDFPVSTTPDSYEFMRDLYQSGACEIGAHLQPWDNPPFREQRNEPNSFPGNLPFDLERDKLRTLTDAIEQNVGVRPRVYKAGRYGVGSNTPHILAELGYQIDLSVLPRTDLTSNFGPDFSRCSAAPYWFHSDPALLEIPLCIGYTGLLAQTRDLAYLLSMSQHLKALHVPGILARLRLLDRITLTPEGITFDEQAPLTPAMLRNGQKIFSFCYHSPSLLPGHTPYVRNEADLDGFLYRIEKYLDFFMGEIGGRALTPFEIWALGKRKSVSRSSWVPTTQS